MTHDKIKTREWLTNFISEAKKNKKIVGFTSGAFDILHFGHVSYLREAKKICDYLIVAINSDNSIKKYKDPKRPIIPCDARTELISELECVDFVFNFDELNNNENINLLKPDIYIKAGDYSKQKLSSASIVESYGGRVELIPVKEKISTTEIINKILDVYAMPYLCSYDKTITYEKMPAIFLDRDGTIIEDVGYISDSKKVKLLPNALEGLEKFLSLGFRLIITTNQPGIGLGYYTKEDFYAVNKEMMKQLSTKKILISKIYFSPHSKSDNSTWRKPNTGMVEQACKDLNIDMSKSFFIGDSTADIMTAKNANLKSILVETGNAGKDNLYNAKPDFTAKDLLDASNFITK